MDENKLKQLAKAFVRELQTSKDLQDHMAEHRRRSQRAREMLRLEHIPSLTEDDLFVLFSDSDSFSPWFLRDKERGFKARLQKFGIERLRDALRELVARGERGLTSDDLGLIWKMRGLGTLLSTELLAYRFPTRYWTYSPNVTLPAFQKLGEDVKAAMPRGQKSEPYVYLALQPHMDKVSQALRDAGLKDVDYLTADVFLWWVKQEATEKAPGDVAGTGEQTVIELTPEEGRAIEALFDSSPPLESPEEEEARRVFEAVLPDPKTRRTLLGLFADYILEAHAAGERCWEVTLSPKHQLVKLNVGWLRAFGVSESCCAVIDPSALSKIEVATLEKEAEVRREGENFKLFQDSLTVWFKPAALGSILPIIAKSYQGFVERAARTGKTSPWWRSHSQGVTAYLRRFLGRDVPDPAYVDIVAPPPDILAAAGRALVSQGLHFTPWQLATFYTALQTKGFVILSGISGTGKTKLAQAFARLLPQPQEGDNWLFVSVRPDWRDSKSLLGYYNPLTGNYEWTDFLRFLLRAERNYRSESSLAWFVILDEMNLAHVEYYFADLLSVLESGRDEAGWTREPLRLSYPDGAQGDLPPRALRLPPNLYIVGTVNVDETTQAFSPKVLDRAFTLELTEADFSAYPPGAGEGRAEPSDEERQAILEDFGNGGTFVRISKEVIGEYVREHPEVRERLQKLSELLRPHELHFGYRVFDEIVSFLDAAERNGLYEDLGGAEAAFDAAVLMKVLPKFHGSRGKLEAALKKVLAWCLNPDRPAVDDVERTIQGQGRESMDGGAAVEVLAELGYTYQRTAGRVLRMLRALYETGFAAFA